jgi:hypothetical protein
MNSFFVALLSPSTRLCGKTAFPRRLERFANYFGKSPEALACLWDDLQSTQIEAARVKGTEKMFYYYLMSSVFGGVFLFFQSHLVARGRIWSQMTRRNRI